MSETSFSQATADFATEMAEVLRALPAAMSSPAARRINAATLRLQRAAERFETDLDARFAKLKSERLAEAPELRDLVIQYVNEAAKRGQIQARALASEPGSRLKVAG